MIAISIVAFAIKDSLGDPVRELVGENVSQAERAELRQQLGLDDSIPVQYGRFALNMVQGDLGTSYIFRKPALGVILSKFSATFELVLAAALIVALVSIPAGIYCAIRPRSWLARLIMGVSVLGISVPIFLTGIFLITIFSVELGWFPSFGRGETVTIGGWETGLLTADGLSHLVLPAITLSSIMLPLFIRLVRGQMIDVLGEDFVRTAWAKGLSPWRVWIVHALRNAAIPLITLGGLQIGTLLAYTILTETVFQWPGMGFMFLDAVNRADVPLIIAYVVVVGVIFVTVNTLVDILYVLVDPRVSLGVRST